MSRNASSPGNSLSMTSSSMTMISSPRPSTAGSARSIDQMRLHPYSVNRYIIVLQPERKASRLPETAHLVLDVVVVDEHPCGGVASVRGLECQRDVVGPDLLRPERLAEIANRCRLVGYGLVDDVPGR